MRSPISLMLLATSLGVGCHPAPSSQAAVTASSLDASVDRSAWQHEVLYLIMTDRFSNGDPSNDQLGSPNCFDPANPFKFHGGDFAGIQARLPYLQDLGVTTVWATPVAQQIPQLPAPDNRCGYHGYWADLTSPNDGAIEPKLGTEADLNALIGALHTDNMKFVMDLVVNHTGDTARLPHQHPEYFHNPATCAQLGNPLVDCPLDNHPDFAQEVPAVADYLNGMTQSWATRFALDGVRMDTAMYVPLSYFTSQWLPALRAIRPGAFTVAEVFNESGAAALAPFVNGAFDATFNFPLRRALVDALGHGGSMDEVANRVQDELNVLGLPRTLMMVNMVDNHDVRRFVNEPGLGVSEPDIARRYQVALTALFTLPGIPQLYYGDELGLYGNPDPDNRHDMPAWAWSAQGRGQAAPGFAVGTPQNQYAFTQKLIQLHKANAPLMDGDYKEIWRPNGNTQLNLLAFLRRLGNDRILTVLNGNGTGTTTVTIPIASDDGLAEGTVLTEALGAGAPASVTVVGGSITLSLPPNTPALYLP